MANIMMNSPSPSSISARRFRRSPYGINRDSRQLVVLTVSDVAKCIGLEDISLHQIAQIFIRRGALIQRLAAPLMKYAFASKS
jgi:hypothetical protein